MAHTHGAPLRPRPASHGATPAAPLESESRRARRRRTAAPDARLMVPRGLMAQCMEPDDGGRVADCTRSIVWTTRARPRAGWR